MRLPPVFADKLDEIAAIARKYDVTRLFLFGSGLSDNFDPHRSDLIELGPIANPYFRAEVEATRYLLYEAA